MQITSTGPHRRFVRRTTLEPDEYRKNFKQIDCDVLEALTSAEACRVTPLISKIYLRLINAPAGCWERQGVLHFTGYEKEGEWVTAWDQLLIVLEVASATARKALLWMHDEGIIGYVAHRNGVGIRIFINRAASSIARDERQKNLRLIPTSSGSAHTSRNEVPFNDSFAVLEVLETDKNPRAPESGADKTDGVKSPPDFAPAAPPGKSEAATHSLESMCRAEEPAISERAFAESIVKRLRDELGSSLETAVIRAAAREHERTRTWLDTHCIPKATRVAQREAYNVLRKHGLAPNSTPNARAAAEIDRDTYVPPRPHPLAEREIAEWAEVCVSLWESQGQAIDRTLAGLSVEAGGFLLPQDAAKIRSAAGAAGAGTLNALEAGPK